MKDKVLIMDTCILCVWLGIPYMDDCGADKNKWTIKRVQKKIDEEIKKGTKFVLPIATIIETGNQIDQCTLTTSGASDDCRCLPRLCHKRNI